MFSGIMEKNRGQEIGYKVSVPNQLKVNNKDYNWQMTP